MKNKKKIPMRASRGLKWENKMYKLKRSIICGSLLNKNITFTQLRFWLKVFFSLKVIPFLLLSHTTKCQSKSINEKSKRIVFTRQLQPPFFKLPIGYTQLHAKAKISDGDKPFPPRFLAYPFLSSMLQCSNDFQERCASHTQCSSRLCVSTILADIRQPSGSRQL